MGDKTHLSLLKIVHKIQWLELHVPFLVKALNSILHCFAICFGWLNCAESASRSQKNILNYTALIMHSEPLCVALVIFRFAFRFSTLLWKSPAWRSRPQGTLLAKGVTGEIVYGYYRLWRPGLCAWWSSCTRSADPCVAYSSHWSCFLSPSDVGACSFHQMPHRTRRFSGSFRAPLSVPAFPRRCCRRLPDPSGIRSSARSHDSPYIEWTSLLRCRSPHFHSASGIWSDRNSHLLLKRRPFFPGLRQSP